MEEKGLTRFPIVVYLPQEKGDNKFFLISAPEKLPINKNIMVFAICADENTLESIRKAYSLGYNMGMSDQSRQDR